MKVFNLTTRPLVYRGQTLSPNGGSAEFKELDVFVSDRDNTLVANRVIALGSLPFWWTASRAPTTKPKTVVVKIDDAVDVQDAAEFGRSFKRPKR